MSYKKLLNQMFGLMLISLFLIGCGGKTAQPTATLIHPTTTPIPPTTIPIPPTITPIPSPTLPPTPAVIPGSNEPMTVGDFEFQITEVRIADSLNDLPSGPVSNYKGVLVVTENGFVPKDAEPGNMLLMVFITLQSGDYQSFMDTDLEIFEGDSEKSSVATLIQPQDNRVIWVYDVKPSSRSFLLVFPDVVILDLAPITP